jgi:hypothetical protein
MAYPNFHSASVAATGQTVTTTVSTATTAAALPNTSANTRPRYVRFATTGTVHVRLGVAGVAAATTDMMVHATTPEILNVGTRTHWSAIDNGTAAVVNVTPLEES